jgi:hypothetical protein
LQGVYMPTDGKQWQWKEDAPGRKALSESKKGKQFGVPFEKKHGLGGTLAYNSWKKMMHRCYNQKSGDYRGYGARGIVVCERWHDTVNFVADMGMRAKGMSLERIDVDGNYEPGNCIWLPHNLQAKNRRKWKHTAEGLASIASANKNQDGRTRESYLPRNHPDRLTDSD